MDRDRELCTKATVRCTEIENGCGQEIQEGRVRHNYDASTATNV